MFSTKKDLTAKKNQCANCELIDLISSYGQVGGIYLKSGEALQR